MEEMKTEEMKTEDMKTEEKKKIVITGKHIEVTANHVLFWGGLIGTLGILVSMGINWVRVGTPFGLGIGIFNDLVLDSLFTIAWPVMLFIWGWSELRKKKNKEKE